MAIYLEKAHRTSSLVRDVLTLNKILEDDTEKGNSNGYEL
jgi:hypothetical protein